MQVTNHSNNIRKMKEEMLNKLTTNYSFFMREPQHFEFIKKEKNYYDYKSGYGEQ